MSQSSVTRLDGKPTIRKTYGRARPTSSSIIFESSPALPSSPPSTRLDTPPTSPGLPRLASPVSSDIGDVIEVKPTSPIRKMQSSLKGFFTPMPAKRPLAERTTIPPSTPVREKESKPSIQMHLTHLPLLHSCKECSMSFVRGGEDEHLHAKHHAKVVRGIPWDGLGKGKGKARSDWRIVQDNVTFGSGREKGKGKVIMCEGSFGGSKLDDILSMVDTVLSSPAILPIILDQCRIFLFVTSSPPPSTKRQRVLPGKTKAPIERIVGVVVAQPIKTALRVLKEDEQGVSGVDSGGGVMCDPEPLDTPLGIHRVFTIPSYRSLGLARILLDAAARHTVYGCEFDAKKGQVAFSQPTDSGRRTMEKWGEGAVRVFIDDERQL